MNGTSPFPPGLPMEIPPELVGIFNETEADLREFYGDSPDVPMLIRMWLGCATSEKVRKLFEELALSVPNSTSTAEGEMPP